MSTLDITPDEHIITQETSTPDSQSRRSWLPAVFHERDFRLLWLGEAISMIGDQFYMIALPWLVLQLTGDALAMGTVLALAGVPRALFMLVGGALTDRFSPRAVMLASNLIRGALVAGLTVLVLSGATELWMLYLFALAFGMADAFFYPAQSAIVPQVAPPEELQTANAVVQGTGNLALFAGPVLAGVLIALLGSDTDDGTNLTGIGLAFGVDTLTFLASAFTLMLMRLPNQQAADAAAGDSVVAAIRAGLAHLWDDTLVRAYFVMIALANVFINGPLVVGTPLLADSRLPEGAAAFGILMSAFGGGMLGGIIVAGAMSKPEPRRLGIRLLIVWSGMGLGVILLGLVRSTPLAALFMVLTGAANGYVVIQFVTWLQERTPPQMMGRMMSLLMFASAGLMPISTALTGALMELDMTATFIASGGLMMVVVLSVMFNRRLRTMGADDT